MFGIKYRGNEGNERMKFKLADEMIPMVTFARNEMNIEMMKRHLNDLKV